MKAIEIKSPRNLNRIEIDEPSSPSAGHALVQTHVMGICGTDVSCYLGKFPFFDYPRIPGHELGVEVLEVGEGVSHLQVGDRCSVEPYLNCGKCHACRRQQGNCCENLQVIGVMTDGGLCDRFLIRADKLHPSSSLSYEQLSLVETLAIGCHATDRCNPQGNEEVLVIGAGPIGLAALEFVRLTGARITVMDLAANRLEFCQRNYDIENTIQFHDLESAVEQAQQLTRGDRFQYVIDATGNHHSMANALQFVAHTGTLVYVGITTEEIVFPHPLMHRPEMSILSSRNALPHDFRRIIKLIEGSTITTDPWITHRTSFDKVTEDFDSFLDPDLGVIKAIIEVL